MSSEVPSSSENQRKIDTYSTENTIESQKQEVNLLATKIGVALGTKFEGLGIVFDIHGFRSKLSDVIGQVFLNPDIPKIAKEKFKQDILSKVSLLSEVTIDDIKILQTRRNIESLGVEALELRGKTDAQKQAYYLDKILTQTLGKYVTPTTQGLIEAFSKEKLTVKKSGIYVKDGLSNYEKMIRELDQKYGLSILSISEKKRKQSDELGIDYMNAGLNVELRLGIFRAIAQSDKEFATKHKNLLLTLERNPAFQIQFHPSMVVRLKSNTYPLKQIIDDYTRIQGTWHQGEHEVREARDIALAQDVFSKMRSGLGMEQLKSEFDHLGKEDIEEKIKQSSFADMVIMVTQLAQIAPIVGDITGGSLDIGSAITGISNDGAKLSTVERSLSGVFGVLGVTVFAGFLNRARKAGKLASVLSGLMLLKKYLPAKLETFLKNGGKVPENVRNFLSGYLPQILTKVEKNAQSFQLEKHEVKQAGTSQEQARGYIGLTDTEREILTGKIREIQERTGLRVPKEKILQTCEELRQLRPNIHIENNAEDLETIVNLLDLRPDFSFRTMPLVVQSYEVFPFNLGAIFHKDYGLKPYDLALLRDIDIKSFYAIFETGLSELTFGLRSLEEGNNKMKEIIHLVARIPQGQSAHVANFLRYHSSDRQAVLEILLEKGVDFSGFSRLQERLMREDNGNGISSKGFQESAQFDDFLSWIRKNPNLEKAEIEKVIGDIADGKTVSIPLPWEPGKIPKITPSQRIEKVHRGLSEGEKTLLTGKTGEILSRTGLDVPLEMVLEACHEVKQLKPYLDINVIIEDLEILVRLIELRPDFSFRKMPLGARQYEVFPFKLIRIFNKEYGIGLEDLKLLREVDSKTFCRVFQGGFANLIPYIGKNQSTDITRKIIELATRVSEDGIDNIDAVIRLAKDQIIMDNPGVYSQKLMKLIEILLSKGVDLSEFTRGVERFEKLRSTDKTAYNIFREESKFGEFMKGVIESPNLIKEEIENRILALFKSLNPITESTPKGQLDYPKWMLAYDKYFHTESFNPEKGLQDIRKLPSRMRKDAMEVWKKRYHEQMSIISEIPSKIRHELFEGKLIEQGIPDEILEKLITTLGPSLEKLSIAERKEVLQRSRKYIEKAKAVRTYAEKYKDSPKDLIATCLDTDVTKLKGEVTMEVNGANFTFYIHNSDDYRLLEAYGNEEMAAKSIDSAGVSIGFSKIDELKGTITLQKGKKTSHQSTQIHETAHADNNYRMPDRGNGDPLSMAKDEIIAYLTDGSNIRDIADSLFKKESDRGIYDYYWKMNPDNYEALRVLYESELSRLIRVADRFKRNKDKFPHYLDLLAVTPARNWHRIEEFYLGI